MREAIELAAVAGGVRVAEVDGEEATEAEAEAEDDESKSVAVAASESSGPWAFRARFDDIGEVRSAASGRREPAA